MKALELDDTVAEAHSLMGGVNFTFERDFAAAEREYRRAIELSPNQAMAHFYYSYHLSAMGRHDEAIAEAKRALELDPLSPITNTYLGYRFYYARQYDQAIEQLRKAIDMDSSFWLAHEFLAHAYWGKGEFEKATSQLQQATSLADDPMILGDLGNAYALSGKRDKAENVLNDLKELSKKRFVSPFAMVPLYASLGNKDAAFELLQKAIEDHSEYVKCPTRQPLLLFCVITLAIE